MKPVLFAELCQVTVVPAFTQKGAFDFEFGMAGVTVAEVPPLRFRSTTHGAELDPQRLEAVQILVGFVSVQAYLLARLFCALATTKLASESDNRSPVKYKAGLDSLF
ncbi:MAG: hypothetical protein WB723_20140, partial [Candidatus Acidiferrales bacterium]